VGKYELFTGIELDAIYRSVRLDETTFGATQVGEEILKDIEKRVLGGVRGGCSN